MSTNPFIVAGQRVQPGTRRQINLPAGRLPSGTELSLRLQVLHGIEPGPTVWFSGAIHGDEIVGVEIIRRILETLDERDLRGTIIAVPVVNVFGFVAESRYLPDRRDLNRSFPGSRRGSLASRLARLFVDNVLEPTVFGIDFHAGSDDRTNLPQVRGNLDDEETRRLAMAFSAPLMLHAKTIRGSLRETAVRRGKRVLLFEGGEPRRFNPGPVQAGADGALRVLHALEMIGTSPPSLIASAEARSTKWIRAPRGGIFHLQTRLGAHVRRGDLIGVITEPSGRGGREVRSRASGMIMGHAVNPLVHQGDSLVHIAGIE